MSSPLDKRNSLSGEPLATGVGARLGRAIDWTMGLLLIVVVGINVANATGRHLFSYSVTGADELMVYLIVLLVMAGAVRALAQRQHININLLPSYAHGRSRVALYIFHDLIALAATLYTANASWTFVQKIMRLDTTSMSMGIPMSIPHSMVFLGFAGMALIAFFCLLRDIRALIAFDPRTSFEGDRS
ncbi:MAG: TRAP transporter small permease [Alphaproteobacteria bacterium]|nr:TRAP transporter small permease [Alphaproteobacteria bacterium]